jgi:hypothetical protein
MGMLEPEAKRGLTAKVISLPDRREKDQGWPKNGPEAEPLIEHAGRSRVAVPLPPNRMEMGLLGNGTTAL